MGERITQDVAEVFLDADARTARITQDVAEVFLDADARQARVTQEVVEVWIRPTITEGLQEALMADGRILKKQEHTVWLRKSDSFDNAQWGGACMRVEDIETDLGGVNPTHRQDVRKGGVIVDGYTRSLPGLPTSQLVMKETQVSKMAERLQSCRWDVDRRTHCKNMDDWNAWEKIRRVCGAIITSSTYMGSTFNEDDEEELITLPLTGTGTAISINRVSGLSDQVTAAAAVTAMSVCTTGNCPSRCGCGEDTIVTMATAFDAVATNPVLINYTVTADGEITGYTETALTEYTADPVVAMVCLGDFLLMAGENDGVDLQFIRSYDRGATRTTQAGTTDMATNPVSCLDAISQSMIIAGGENGYVYQSTDGSLSWQTVSAADATVEDLRRIRICRQNPAYIYAIGANNAFIKSDNGGRTWFSITGPNPGNALYALCVLDENRVLVGDDEGKIWESCTGGNSWTEQAALPGLTATSNVYEIVDAGCGVLGCVLSDTNTTSYFLLNVEGGASGHWYQTQEGALEGLGAGQVPTCAVAIDANRFIVGGGAAATGFYTLVV